MGALSSSECERPATRCECSLPRRHVQLQPIAARHVLTSWWRRGVALTVMVVEDELPLRKLFSRVLSRKGYTVITAANGVDALDRARRYANPIDILVTDMILPSMDGRQVATQMKILYPDIRVLYITGYTNEEMIARGLRDETATLLEKPFSLAELIEAVRGL